MENGKVKKVPGRLGMAGFFGKWFLLGGLWDRREEGGGSWLWGILDGDGDVF